MKRNILTLSLLLVVTVMMAIPAKRGVWKTIKLSDGTEVKATLQGDEFTHYWKGIDGKKYVKSGNTYVLQGEETQKKANARRMVAQQQRDKRANKMKALRKNASPFYTGDKKGLIILVQFQDTKFQEGNDQTLFDHVANTPGYTDDNGFNGSVSDYFKAQSREKFNLTFDVVGPVTVGQNVAYYGEDMPGEDSEDPEEGNDRAPEEMVREAVNLVKNQITNWKQYDWDDDGEVDQVMIIYAGEGQASGGDANTIWPHEYMLYYRYKGKDYGERVKVGDNLYVNTYAVANEIQLVENPDEEAEDEDAYIPQHMGIGTICHEFSHCLGLMDMYDTTYGDNFGMGDWDLMDDGSYNGDGFIPANYTSYEKMQIGWVTPTELTSATAVSSMQAWEDADECYKITNPGNSNEYYLLENRQQKGWDEFLPSSGLLILHVDYDPYVWQQNIVNSTPEGYNDHQRCTIFHADGKDKQNEIYAEIEELYWIFMFGMDTDEDEVRWNELWDEYDKDAQNDVYPLGGTELSNTSKPRAFTYHANTDGRKLMNIKVSEITQNTNGTIAFNFAPDNSGTEEGDNTEYSTISVGGNTDLPEGTLFYESFDYCDGEGGNDDEWGSSVASDAFYADNDGWEADAAYGGYECARFGSSKKKGIAKTPTISFTNSTTLTFKAAAWGTDGTTLKLSAEGAKIILTPSQVTMKSGEWTEFTVTTSGAGNAKIVFTPAKRFFLDEVLVVDQTATGIQEIQAVSRPKDGKIYSIDGRYVGNDFGKVSRGLYIINGKKVIK